jgi:glutathione S-transferase
MILYATPLSSFSTKVRIAIAAKGLTVEERMPIGGSYRSAEYRAIVPMGTVPALIDRDFVLAESDAIIEYLEEEYPDPPLMPQDARGRARARVLSRFHDFYLDPPLRRLFAHLEPSRRSMDAVAEQLAEIRRRLAQFESLITPAPYLVGRSLTLADCAYPATLTLMDLILPELGEAPAYGPRTEVWRDVLLADRAVQRVLGSYRATASAWVGTKVSGS